MHIKILILCLGVICVTGLFAQDMQRGVATPEQGSAQVDSSKTVYLPFGKSPAGLIASDVTVIRPEELLRYDNIATVEDLINGRVPGLFGGVNLRGMGDALILIDGVPRSLSSVRLREIEQISVLKDANAAMLYGVQAKRGVILIKTKRGEINKKRISTLVEFGIEKPISYPKYLGSADYMDVYNEALANDGLLPLYTQGVIDGTRSGVNLYKYPDVNYYNPAFLKNNKSNTRIETEFSGGNENGQFYANIGWERSGSLLNMGEVPSGNRLNLRTNLDFKINKFISSHVDIVTIFNVNKNPQGDFFNGVTTLKPNYFPLLIDTSMIVDKKLMRTAEVINGRYVLGGTSQYRNNMYGNLLLSGYNKQFTSTGMFNTGLDFDLSFLLKGLTLKTNASFDFDSRFDETQSNTYAVYETKWGKVNPDSLGVTKHGVDKFTGTQGLANTSMLRGYAYFGVLNYAHVYGGVHALSTSLVAYADKTNRSGVFQSDKHSHLGTQINYVYRNKYILDFTSSLVSSPKLASTKRLAFSPSLSAGWVISEEDFLKDNEFINYLKITGSAGIINTDMSLDKYYTYDDIWREYDSYIQGDGTRTAATTNLNNAANANLYYEKRKEFNVGVEAALFQKALWLNARYFLEKQTDQIVDGLNNTYPAFLGGFNPSENHSEDEFSGWELGLSYRKSMGDVNVEITPSVTFLKTKAVKRDEFYGYDYQYRAGNSTGAIFGLESLGLFQDIAEIEAAPTQLFGPVQPGDIRYKDQNGDDFIDSNDEVVIGNNLPKVRAGLSFTLNYKNLTLFAFGTLRDGSNSIFNNSYYWVSGDRKYSEVVLNRWTPETAETAVYPRLSSKSNNNNFRTSTFWIEDNSLASLERVQLTYDLPKSVAKMLQTSNFSLYLRGGNLINFAKNKDKMELNIGSEPQYRNFSIGLKALF